MTEIIDAPVNGEAPKFHIVESPPSQLTAVHIVAQTNVLDAPPPYDPHEHKCVLIDEGWPAQRNSKKFGYIWILVPIPVPTIINLVVLTILLNDRSSHEEKDEMSLRIALYIDSFILATMLIVVVLGTMAVLGKKPKLFLTVGGLLVGLAALYVYLAVAALFNINVFGLIISVAMISWLLALIYLTRSVHLAKLRLCKQCY